MNLARRAARSPLGLRAALAVLLVLAVPGRAAGADFWQRLRGHRIPAERETQQALFRAEAGTSDAVDELVVRVAMVDGARGKRYGEALTTTIAARTRRLLGLPRAKGDEAELRAIVERDEAAEITALAALELGRLLRLQGDVAGAALEYERAVGRAWQTRTRVEAHLMRGWLAVAAGDWPSAAADFRSTLAFELSRSELGLALASLAYVDLATGDAREARRHWDRSREVLAGGEAISPVAPRDRPELLPADRAALDELERRLVAAPPEETQRLQPRGSAAPGQRPTVMKITSTRALWPPAPGTRGSTTGCLGPTASTALAGAPYSAKAFAIA